MAYRVPSDLQSSRLESVCWSQKPISGNQAPMTQCCAPEEGCFVELRRIRVIIFCNFIAYDIFFIKAVHEDHEKLRRT